MKLSSIVFLRLAPTLSGMQRFFLLFILAGLGVFQAQALPPISFDQFSKMTYQKLDPYIDDYYKRYPEQKGTEITIRKFFQEHPPDLLMVQLQKDAPLFYAGVKAKAVAAQTGKSRSKYTLDDFLLIPEAEELELAKLTGPYLHTLLTDQNSRDGLQKLARKENRALEVAFMLVQMRAQQTSAESFSADLSQIMMGLAQLRQSENKPR